MADPTDEKVDYDFGDPNNPDVEINDDWIRQLPSAKAEREMIEALGKEHAAREAQQAKGKGKEDK